MTTRSVWRWTICLMVGLVLCSSAAQAQSMQADMKQGPWSRGVAPEQRQAATEYFQQGNALLKDAIFVQAVQMYRQAIAQWDHPAIHYNLALALMNLDQPIEVYESLQKAVRYGADPLGQDKYERANSYTKLISQQLAQVEIVCDEPNAKVTLDGKLLFIGPGKYQGLVRIGEHSVVARKPGYIPDNDTRLYGPEDRVRIELELFTPGEVTEYRRRWAPWKPWLTVGSGVGVVALGVAMQWMAIVDFQSYDERLAIQCPEGCVELPQELVELESGARLKQNIAIPSYAVGGAAFVTGLILVYVNRPQPYRIGTERAEQASAVPLVAPMIGPNTAGITASLRF